MRTVSVRPDADVDRIAATLFGRTRRRVLALLLGRPEDAYYLREIVRLTDAAPATVQRELRELTAAGILERFAKGNQVYHRANRACPVFGELRSIIEKTTGLVGVLRDVLTPLRDRVVVSVVFGSMASGHAGSSSDVDLLVVGDVTFGEVVDAVSAAQPTIGRDVNPVVYTIAEFRARVRRDDHFLSTVLRAPLQFVIGDANELARLGEEWVGDDARDESPGDRRPARPRGSRSARQRGRGDRR